MSKIIKHIDGKAGGILVGKSHANGGIKAINMSTGQPLEMQGGEVVITKPAVDDKKLYQFQGQLLTNRQILSKINESGGGVSFAELESDIPNEIYFNGNNYEYGGEMLDDYEIAHRISKCSCNHEKGGEIEKLKIAADSDDYENVIEVSNNILDVPQLITPEVFEDGGYLKSNIEKRLIDDMAYLVNLQYNKINKISNDGMDINLFKSSFFNKVKNMNSEKTKVVLDYLTELENVLSVKPIFSKNHKIWTNYEISKSNKTGEFSNENKKSKFNVGDYVSYNTGDLEIEKWVGIIKEVKDYDIEFAYAIDAYTTNVDSPMFDSEKTNEKYEVSLKNSTKQKFEDAKKSYDSIKSNKQSDEIIKLRISPENNLSKQLIELTGDQWNDIDFKNLNENKTQISLIDPFIHIKSGKKFIVINDKIEYKLSNYKNPYEVNRAIENLLDSKTDNFSPNEIEFISNYSGYGGLEKQGEFSDEELKGLLYEYFTPDEIVKKMWALAYKYGFGVIKNPHVLEPSVGTGNFFKYAPNDAELFGNEINKYSKKICEILYPNSMIKLQPFEKTFISQNNSIKQKLQNIDKYHLVIGNPPYGKGISKYLAMGETSFTNATNFTEYFITRGLDLLHSQGLLIYVVGAEQYNGGTLFLDSGISIVKKQIFEKAQLIDAYKLPTKIFERTAVASEILVFKKK